MSGLQLVFQESYYRLGKPHKGLCTMWLAWLEPSGKHASQLGIITPAVGIRHLQFLRRPTAANVCFSSPHQSAGLLSSVLHSALLFLVLALLTPILFLLLANVPLSDLPLSNLPLSTHLYQLISPRLSLPTSLYQTYLCQTNPRLLRASLQRSRVHEASQHSDIATCRWHHHPTRPHSTSHWANFPQLQSFLKPFFQICIVKSGDTSWQLPDPGYFAVPSLHMLKVSQFSLGLPPDQQPDLPDPQPVKTTRRGQSAHVAGREQKATATNLPSKSGTAKSHLPDNEVGTRSLLAWRLCKAICKLSQTND